MEVFGSIGSNFVPENPPKYVCENCDLYTNSLKDFNKHLKTNKHNKHCLEVLSELDNKTCFLCICNKKYKTHSGLWKHKKKCNIKIPKKSPKKIPNESSDDINKLTELVMDVVKQNKELTKQIIELSSKPTTTNNTTNNSFNLQFFLNETCKDALNITDFINQLQVGTKDLEETGRLGYAEGISKIFINGLKKLNVNQRPVHCSDVKREIIYIKDGGQWEKDNDENVKLTNAIRDVAHKNIEQIQVWTELHPEYTDLKSKFNDRYMKLIGEAMSGSTNEETYRNYKKIARNIMRETIIPK